MHERRENWPLHLSEYLKIRKNMPFKWGEHDCLTFVSGAVAAITGYNFYDEYLPYDSEETAAEMLREYNGVAGIITEHLGEGSDKILTAGRGDVVLFKAPEGDTAGIVDDTGRYFQIITEKGLLRIPLSKANRVWSY